MLRGKIKFSVFSRTEVICYLSLSLISLIGVAYFYLLSISNNNLEKEISRAENILTKISSELGKATGVLSSIASVQQILDDPYGDQLDAFATQSIKQSELINTLSRYERVNAENLEEFAKSMSESGAYNFSIATINEIGVKKDAQIKPVYYPLIWKQPFNPRSAMMIGVDLSSNAAINTAIEISESNNLLTISEVPRALSKSEHSDVLLILPTYFGRYIPDIIESLHSQSNGGVMMGLGLTDFLRNNLLLQPGYAIDVSILDHNSITDASNTNPNGKIVSHMSEEPEKKRYLVDLFPGIQVTANPIAGKNTLQVRIRSIGGISSEELIRAALITVGLSFLICLLFSMLYNVRRASESSKRTRETALVTLRTIDDSVITTDQKGVITYANPSTNRLLNLSDDQLIGEFIEDVIHAAHVNDVTKRSNVSSVKNALTNSATVKLPEMCLGNSVDDITTVSSSLSPIGNDENHAYQGHVLVMRDITAERELTKELEFLANNDSLTKISNRYHFEQCLQSIISTSKIDDVSHALCYIDLDQFKTINDTCGHSAGDELLKKISNDLFAFKRDSDVLARLGGDEFGLIIKNCTEAQAVTIASQLYDMFQSSYFQHGKEVFAVRASIGFVYINGQFENIEDVMAAADLACYTAKDRGRNELHIFNHNDVETADRKSEMMWLPKIQMALRRDYFLLFVQPIVKTKIEHTSAIHDHYEILLRLKSDDGKLITPVQMIVAAERYDIMRDIDRWVIESSIAQIARLKEVLADKLPTFSINISGQSTLDNDLAGFIKYNIQQTGIDASELIFEITETSAITNMRNAVELIDSLHEIGCEIALDDFGAGVSSFGYLKSLPVDYLKIDGQFIRNIHKNSVDREMVKCIQAVADLLEISTVAEFVENEEIVDVLCDINVKYAQGYYYGKPHPFSDLLELGEQSKAA